MLKELQFVRNGIAKKDFDPTLTHFLIKDRRVWSFNGIIGLSAPIECDLDIAPKASQFVRALSACDEVISLHMTPKGQLGVTSGKFKTLVDCVPPEEHNTLAPTGAFVEVNGKMLAALKTLEPFIGYDASRKWACGILFRGQHAYATNNIAFIEHGLEAVFPIEVNIPTQAVRELIRIGEEPLGLQVDGDRLTFYYSGYRWLMTRLTVEPWPVLDKVFALTEVADYSPIPKGLGPAVEKVLPFADDMGRVIFNGKSVSTSAEVNATVLDFDDAPGTGSFNGKHLLAMAQIAHSADFTKFPVVPFKGNLIRGVMAGLR